AITIMLRPKADETSVHRVFVAAVMLLPIAVWTALRFAFFGGFGGTYATQGYTPWANFLRLTFFKLTHLQHIFVLVYDFEGHWALSRAVGIGAALLIYALLFLWALNAVPKTLNSFCHAARHKHSPEVDVASLVTLWAVLALAFQFALPTTDERYATAVVVF